MPAVSNYFLNKTQWRACKYLAKQIDKQAEKLKKWLQAKKDKQTDMEIKIE